MPSTTLSAPVSFDAVQGVGATPTFVSTDILELAMQDTINPVSTGMVALKGDLAGSGSDEMRILFMDGLGYGERFAALGSETDRPTPTGSVLGYSTLTIATQGLAKSQTWRQTQLGKSGQFVSMEQMIQEIPNSFLATLRYKAAVAGSAVGTIIGSASDALTASDWYALRTAAISQRGAGKRGRIRATLHPAQLNQLSNSFQSEPSVITNLEAFRSVAGVDLGEYWENWLGFGVDIAITDDVVNSGGAFHGFAGTPGFMGWGRASTSRLNIPAALDPVRVDAYGLLMYRAIDQAMNRTDQIEAIAEIGIALGDSTVYFQRRLRSINT